MSRAMRRHPAAQQKAKRQPKSPPIRTSARRPPQREGRGGAGVRFQWATDIAGELRKVTWPSREDTYYLTFVVLVVTMAFAVFLGGVDMLFNWAIDRTIIP